MTNIMSYVKLDLEDDDEVTARAMNYIETIAESAVADLATHDHDEVYLSKADAEDQYWSASNGQECNADTLQGEHAADLLGTGASLPIGTIAMWEDALAEIPSGWQLANGSNGTLDMRNYFPVGASSTHVQGATYGAATTTARGDINVEIHVLTIYEIPAHRHWIVEHYYALFTEGFLPVYATGALSTYAPDPWTRSGCITESTGSSYGHGHDGSTWAASSIDNKPEYCGIYFIERIS